MIESSVVLLLAPERTTSLQRHLLHHHGYLPTLDGGCEVAAVLTDPCHLAGRGVRVWCWKSDAESIFNEDGTGERSLTSWKVAHSLSYLRNYDFGLSLVSRDVKVA